MVGRLPSVSSSDEILKKWLRIGSLSLCLSVSASAG
jgi:hypothetical protein